MALNVNTAQMPGTPAKLLALVAAIVAATPVDEPDWLEWKSTLDLSDKSAQGRIARTILGMARPGGR